MPYTTIDLGLIMTKENPKKIKRIFKVLGKVLNALLIVVLLILVAFNVYNIIAKTVFHDDMPKIFGYAGAVVVTGSMSGAIEIGDYIIIKESDEYTKGDIVTFVKDDMLITHRIIEVTQEGFITKGDANAVPDDMIVYEQIKGKVTLVIPKAGKVVDFIRTPLGIVLILALIALIYGIRYTIESTKKRNQKSG
ncbi:MAG: signal peptidase I [Bacillota bacterium]|nr:signal peptidase I [Bacillota bacterium]